MKQPEETIIYRYFENISEYYDRLNTIISFGRHHKWRRIAVNELKIKPGYKILDVCCGTCDGTIALAERTGPSGSVTGLDYSPQMLDYGRKKVDQKNMNNIRLLLGNARCLPFKDNYFDCVSICFGLRNAGEYQQVIKEMHRVLKVNGVAVCLETSQPEISVYKQLFHVYFQLIMPVVAALVSRNYQAYAWLNRSTMNFLNKNELAQMFLDAKFKKVMVKSLSGGVASVHTVLK